MESNTHKKISARLCGEIVSIEEGAASTRFVADEEMRTDEQGLVHGGFIFGLADYAAMLAVNAPNVVLGSSEVRFVAPVRVGEEVVASATVRESKGKKRVLDVVAAIGETVVLRGTMTAFVLEEHVLANR